MSYTVTFVPMKVSGNDSEAFAEVEALQERYGQTEHDARHPALVALHDALVARFPETDDPDDAPWADGPLIENFGSEMGMVAIVFSRVEEVLPAVLEIALAHGITVLDDQTGLVHRPV
jgi:hypothetical protein